jgi:endonuclease/exonuclease/phosphatase (EEP) superfamily protein YafD
VIPLSSVNSAEPATPLDAKPGKPRHRQWLGASFWLLFAVAGLLAGRLGQLYPSFDVFSQFSAQFIAMAFGFSVAMLFSRFKTFFGIGLTAALLAAYGAWPHLVSSPLQKGPYQLAAGEVALRVAHFNTYFLNTNTNALTAEILRLDADVITLVEMGDDKKRLMLPALKAKYPYQYACETVPYCELAVLSVYPISDVRGDGIWVGAPFVRVTLGGAMAGVTVTGVHTTRFPYSRAQLTQVRELVKTLDWGPNDQIIMGDFNASPFSRIISVVEQGANVRRLTELPTWPATVQVPQLAIDHIFASGKFRVIGNQQIGESVGSDHFPILLTLALKRTP